MKQFSSGNLYEYFARSDLDPDLVNKIDISLGGLSERLKIQKRILRNFVGCAVEREKLDSIQRIIPSQMEFIPSFINPLKHALPKSFSHIHIYKCGGSKIRSQLSEVMFPSIGVCDIWGSTTRFPINIFKTHPNSIARTCVSLLNKSHERSKATYDYINYTRIPYASFMTEFHYGSYIDAVSLINSKSEYGHSSFSIYRNPAQRLRSSLQQIYRINDNSLSKVWEKIACDDITLDNSIFHSICCDFRKSQSRVPEKVSVDYLFEMSESVLSVIKSCLLSNWSLPNLVEIKKVNSKPGLPEIPSRDFDELFRTCISKGYLEVDNSEFIGKRVVSEVPKSFFDLCAAEFTHLHPIAILKYDNKIQWMPTMDVIKHFNG